MKKEIVLRIENGNGEIVEYVLQAKRWKYALDAMFSEGGITVSSKMMKKLLTTCDDGYLVGHALSYYEGHLSKDSIKLIKERFWNNEMVQWGLIGYAGQHNCRFAAEAVNPITPNMRREVESMLEVMK